MTSRIGRFQSLVRDFRAADRAELFWRLHRRLAAATGRLRARFPAGVLTDAELRRCLGQAPFAASPEHWAAHLASRPQPSFFFSSSDRTRYQALLRAKPPDDRANPLMRGAALLFGVPIDMHIPPDWQRLPGSTATWPAAHWSEVPLSVDDNADVRILWELNRHRDLFVLGRAYWRTGERSYADAASVRLVSWLERNPSEIGINWWSNLEIAVRAQAWIWALHFFADAFDPSLVWRVTAALVASARHMATDLAYTRRTMPGNHVIGDAAGLAMIALVLPELRESRGWYKAAIRLLEQEAEAQVRSDGTHEELSPAYAAFVWELLFVVMALARRNGIEMPVTRDALQSMARALVLVSTPDGEVPQLGDSDDGVAYDLGDNRGRIGAIAALSVSALGLPDLNAAADPDAEELLWLTGNPTLAAPHAVAGTMLPLAAVTGFGVCARSQWDARADYCLLRHGGVSKHTHADALNLCVTVNGVPCLIDAGTGTYNASVRWRRYFRGTSAHSTVQLDSCDHGQPHRTFRWSRGFRSTAEILRTDRDSVFISGHHDAFEHACAGHTRQVLWLRQFGWIVVDRVTGQGDHLVELRWIMPDVTKPLPSGARVEADGVVAELAIITPASVVLHRGLEDPPIGWTSSRYGEWHPATCVVASQQMLPCELISVLAPLQSAAERLKLTRLESAAGSVGLRAVAGDRAVDVSIGRDDWSYLQA